MRTARSTPPPLTPGRTSTNEDDSLQLDYDSTPTGSPARVSTPSPEELPTKESKCLCHELSSQLSTLSKAITALHNDLKRRLPTRSPSPTPNKSERVIVTLSPEMPRVPRSPSSNQNLIPVTRRRSRSPSITERQRSSKLVLLTRYFGSPNHKVPINLKCMFCTQKGRHYSDSCPSIRNIQKRQEIISTFKGCQLCLHPRCQGCNKGNCSYCKQFKQLGLDHLIPKEKHHTSVCSLPGTSSSKSSDE